MSDQVRNNRLYDVIEYRAKIITALEMLKKTEQPGEVSKNKRYNEIQKGKEIIQGYVSKGYSLKQIVTAIHEDGIEALNHIQPEEECHD